MKFRWLEFAMCIAIVVAFGFYFTATQSDLDQDETAILLEPGKLADVADAAHANPSQGSLKEYAHPSADSVNELISRQISPDEVANEQLNEFRRAVQSLAIKDKDGKIVSLPGICSTSTEAQIKEMAAAREPETATSTESQQPTQSSPASTQRTPAMAENRSQNQLSNSGDLVASTDDYFESSVRQNPEAALKNLPEEPEEDETTVELASLKKFIKENNSEPAEEIPGRYYNPHANAADSARVAMAKLEGADAIKDGEDPHAGAFSRTLFPSANECRKCHEQIYDEWAVSSHAYASLSPMFHKFENTINKLAQGTIGYFCLRCHAPVATTMELRRDQPIWDGPRVFREGVTCVACHRVSTKLGKVNGERPMVPGGVEAPVYGGSSGEGVERVIKYADKFKVKTDPKDKSTGQLIHRRAIKFDQMSKSSFCVSCHQVEVQPGIKLEIVWEQYRSSKAYRDGITCQDCHMGKVPGRAEGYTVGPAALINGLAINKDRKHSNHTFYGPGYSIAHPGVFPQNPDADRWSVNDWLLFDWRAGWGTEEFEEAVADGKVQVSFPPVWAEADDRYDAWDVISDNLKALKYKRETRTQVMENGSHIDGPFFTSDRSVGKALSFNYVIKNTNSGHNLPSGSLGAQPQVWVNTALVNPNGERVWESGYLDSIGDLADIHSYDVLSRRIRPDTQLVNFQAKFLTTNVKGTDREMYLPINVDFDQLPFIRPGATPNSVISHAPFARMENHSLPPLGSRKAKYKVPAKLINMPGTYRLSVRLRMRAEPMYFMKFVGATPEMMKSMNEGIVDSHPYSVTFEVR